MACLWLGASGVFCCFEHLTQILVTGRDAPHLCHELDPVLLLSPAIGPLARRFIALDVYSITTMGEL